MSAVSWGVPPEEEVVSSFLKDRSCAFSWRAAAAVSDPTRELLSLVQAQDRGASSVRSFLLSCRLCVQTSQPPKTSFFLSPSSTAAGTGGSGGVGTGAQGGGNAVPSLFSNLSFPAKPVLGASVSRATAGGENEEDEEQPEEPTVIDNGEGGKARQDLLALTLQWDSLVVLIRLHSMQRSCLQEHASLHTSASAVVSLFISEGEHRHIQGDVLFRIRLTGCSRPWRFLEWPRALKARTATQPRLSECLFVELCLVICFPESAAQVSHSPSVFLSYG